MDSLKDKYNSQELFLLYEEKIIECRKTRERCNEIKKTQAIILNEIKNRSLRTYRILEKYFKLNQQILNELSSIAYDNKKADAIIISMLMCNLNKDYSSEEVLDKLLTAKKPDINITTAGDTNLNNAGRDVTQNKKEKK